MTRQDAIKMLATLKEMQAAGRTIVTLDLSVARELAEAAVAPEVGSEFSFTLDGIGFSGMPLERVARYMTAVAELVGETAVFVRMDEHSIVFADGGAETAPKSDKTDKDAGNAGFEGGAQ